DGTFTATFYATAEGTTTISANIFGQDLTSPPATITVLPPQISTELSTLNLTVLPVHAGEYEQFYLSSVDTNGLAIFEGGHDVTFAIAPGSATGGTITDFFDDN